MQTLYGGTAPHILNLNTRELSDQPCTPVALT